LRKHLASSKREVEKSETAIRVYTEFFEDIRDATQQKLKHARAGIVGGNHGMLYLITYQKISGRPIDGHSTI
jgi:hypothetical protein